MWWISLIILGVLILWGPIMLFFAKLNKVDPFILDKECVQTGDLNDQELKSFLIVNILKPLFAPLWVETALINKIKKLFKKDSN